MLENKRREDAKEVDEMIRIRRWWMIAGHNTLVYSRSTLRNLGLTKAARKTIKGTIVEPTRRDISYLE